MQILDIMAKSPARCTPDTPIPEVARLMVEYDCGAIPVVQSQDAPKPIGIVTDRDIVVRLVAEGKNPLELTAREAMSEGVVTARPDTSLEAVGDLMEDNQVRRILVVDENGALIGIVSQADIALNASPEVAAEVVKEISEDDPENPLPLGGAYSG